MATTVFADNAKVMSKGQVTIPKDVRAVLGVKSGDKVTFIVEGDVVRGQRSILRNTSAAAADGRGGRKSWDRKRGRRGRARLDDARGGVA